MKDEKQNTQVEILVTLNFMDELCKFADRVDSDAKLNHTIKYLQDITDYIDAWESQISLKNSDFDIVCLKAYVQAKIDILKKERDGNHAN